MNNLRLLRFVISLFVAALSSVVVVVVAVVITVFRPFDKALPLSLLEEG
jgi:hypothetical protein